MKNTLSSLCYMRHPSEYSYNETDSRDGGEEYRAMLVMSLLSGLLRAWPE